MTDRREFLKMSAAAAGAAVSSASPSIAAAQSSSIASLKQYLAANAFKFFSLPPASDEPPTITLAGPVTTAQPATTLPAGRIYPVSDPLIGGPIRQHLRASLPGNPLVNGLPCLALWRSYACKGVARSTTSPTVLRFRTDARVVELVGVEVSNPGSGVVLTLMVDGRLVPTKVLGVASRGASGGWGTAAVRIDFGYRAPRDVWLQTTSFLAYVKVDAGDTLLPIASPTDVQITVVGDSYLQARSASFGDGALAMEIGARLGIRDVAVDSLGGTGYWNSGYNAGNLRDRLPAHAADNSSIYVVVAGMNDYGDNVLPPSLAWPTTQVYEQAVMEYVAALRAAQPGAVIVVTAPFSPIPPMSDASYVANLAVNRSGLGDNLYKAQLQRRAVQAIAGPWVYVDVLMGGGWLNSSGATGDVTNLQWFTGGTPGPGTSASFRPGNTSGGAGGAFGGIATVPVLSGGSYSQSPDVRAVGGSGSGAMLAARLDNTGRLAAIPIYAPGHGYTTGPGGLPAIVIDRAYEIAPASVGVPTLIAAVNPNGMYPLPAFAPAEVAKLNNAPTMLMRDTIHPSPRGVSYLAARLAQNIFDGVMAL